MSASFSQRFLHWLEMGGGSHLVVRLAIALVTASFVGYSGWHRFKGPDDRTMEQALVGRALSEGKGYSSPIIWPQSVAVLKERGVVSEDWQPQTDAPLPELYQAPGYPTLIGLTLRLWGENGRNWLFERPVMENSKLTQPYRGDLLLLGLNVVCAIGAAWGAGLLAQRLFSPLAGLVTVAGVTTSLAMGESLAAVDGTVLLAFLAVLLAWSWEGMVRTGLENRLKAYYLWTVAGGLLISALYLTEYTAGLLLIPWLCSAGWSTNGRSRVAAMSLGLFTFCLAIVPWTARNLDLTGHPMGLAGQSLALKKDDPTAEPLTFRNTDSSDAPKVSARKVLNKGIKGTSEVFSSKIWSGGAQLLSAFALACLLYRFRQASTSQVRWGWLAAWAFAVLGQPFFASGESPRLAAVWLGPWLVILGAGFFMILMDSLRQPTAVMRASLIAGLLVLNTLPMLHHLAEPAGVPFRISQHLPARLGSVGDIAQKGLLSNYHFVSDAPAALSWYGRTMVWSLPSTYRSLTDLHRRHFLAGLLLTVRTMEKSLYSNLLPEAREERDRDRPDLASEPLLKASGWARVWAVIFQQILAQGKGDLQLPRDFPFPNLYLLSEIGVGKTVLFLNPSAEKPKTGGR